MAFSFTNKRGVTYFLHAKVTTTKTGKTQTLYFFAKEKKAGCPGSRAQRVQGGRNGQRLTSTEEGMISK